VKRAEAEAKIQVMQKKQEALEEMRKLKAEELEAETRKLKMEEALRLEVKNVHEEENEGLHFDVEMKTPEDLFVYIRSLYIVVALI
jgi:hypothetical protein